MNITNPDKHNQLQHNKPIQRQHKVFSYSFISMGCYKVGPFVCIMQKMTACNKSMYVIIKPIPELSPMCIHPN
jgi:hypothetical protein